jgi:predicted extracellular nuclease
LEWKVLHLRKFKKRKKMKKHGLNTLCLFVVATFFLAESCGGLQGAATKPVAAVVEPVVETVNSTLPIWANAKDSARIAFYNVENLFDTIDEPMKIDSEYMPNSSLQWTKKRYDAKLKSITKVIDSMGFPSIMGMVEVENRRVLDDLTAMPSLKSKNYGVAHFESPDERGIDCALIYKKSDFEVKNAKPHRIVFPNEANDHTRDILEVSGTLRGMAVTVFVNHFPSRRGGAEASDPKRIFVAKVLKNAVDSVQKADPNARIVIMGDMNDEPSDKSLTQSLGANYWTLTGEKRPSVDKNALYNLAAGVKESGFGSYYYRGEWEVIDQMIVSGSFLDGRSKLVTRDAETVFSADFLTYKDKTGKKLPNRTYTGPTYRGGFSDHFPIYMTVYFK